MNKTLLYSILVGITIIAGTAVYNNKHQKVVLARDTCVQHGNQISMHTHPMLEIQVDDQPIKIPANIGIDNTCMKAVHAHDETGKIHLEYPTNHDFVLGDFFANWNQPFNKDGIMDKKVDDTHTLVMEVDGKTSTDFENLILKDEQKIVIKYNQKK